MNIPRPWTQSSFLTFISPFGSVWNPCFRHVLVIIKHNNGFYQSQFASLVQWIIQPERKSDDERGSGAALESGGPYTWDGRRQMRHFVWIIYLILLNFLQLPHCPPPPLFFPPTPSAAPINHHNTSTHTLQTVTFISSGVNYGCTSC